MEGVEEIGIGDFGIVAANAIGQDLEIVDVVDVHRHRRYLVLHLSEQVHCSHDRLAFLRSFQLSFDGTSVSMRTNTINVFLVMGNILQGAYAQVPTVVNNDVSFILEYLGA
ncbi:unnamed protein product [Vicia faba]|uniref:Uncharacterized protein n=1 Tax=Vicia faba TaxID=3906 RepID=A0AAV0ZY92_VICFA|nr:unnamed protein product [Vicia faba]